MRALAVVAVATVLLLALPPPSAGFGTALPLVASVALPGSGSVAARIDTTDGVFDIDLYAFGPHRPGASTDTFGVLLLKGDQSLKFGFAITGSLSTDRFIVTPLAGVDGELPPAGALDFRSASTDATCTYDCLEMQVRTAPGTYYVVAWSANLGAMQVDLGDAQASAVTRTGTSAALGDAEITQGTPDIQVQQRFSGFHGLGVKVMRDASLRLDAQERLWGFWGFNNAKQACDFRVPIPCIQSGLADLACQRAAGISCDTALQSWAGPRGAGGANQRTFSFLGTPAGAYRFTVDLKVDAYEPGGGLYDPITGLFVVAYENYAYLSLADVALP